MPLKSIHVVVPQGAQKELIARLQTFADSHAFAIRVGHTTPDQQHFLVQMWREDVKVIARNPFDPEFRISFYNNSAEPVPSPVLELLENDLKIRIETVSGATVSVK